LSLKGLRTVNKRKLLRFLGNLLSGAVLLAYGLLVLIPVVWFVLVSIQPSEVINAKTPTLLFTPTTENFIYAFSTMKFGTYYLNSAIVCGAATIIAIIIGSIAAYSFSRHRTRVTKELSFWVLSTKMMPPIAVVIPIYLLMSKVNLLDTYIGLVFIYVAISLPYVVWIMRSFFDEIPQEMDEAAMVDGCGRFSLLGRIILPLAAPGMLSTAVFVFIMCWSEFLFALILTSVEAKTLPVAIAAFITDRGIEWGKMSAGGSVMILPLAIMFYFIQKYLVRGLTFGAVKG
jgi:multiple sugar transport system permease protein